MSLPPLAACLAEADSPDLSAWQPNGAPLVRLPRAALNSLIRLQGPGFASLALLMRDEGYTLAVYVAGGPGLVDVPEPFIAVLSDRDPAAQEAGIMSPSLFDSDSVRSLVRAAGFVVFTAHEDDDAAMLAGIGMVHQQHKSLLVVDAPPERAAGWFNLLDVLRPDFPLVSAGAFARPSTLN